MSEALEQRPQLRPVEAVPLGGEHEGHFAIHDPTGIAEAVLTVTEPALFILSRFDGKHDLDGIMREFEARYGQPVEADTLTAMVKNLESTRLLRGSAFDTHMRTLRQEFRARPSRPSICSEQMGDGDTARSYIVRLLDSDRRATAQNGLIAGVIAPHLDFERGEPCYQLAYRALQGRACPDRCVILGTNHFGWSTSVVATRKAFETPLGLTEVDAAFLDALERRCGADLCEHELDHRREHSIELQLLCLQHVFGAESFRMVPVLCPDPCGPTGTKPIDGKGVDLRDFAAALRDVIRESGGDTLLVAGADLSHVGRQFGDTFPLDQPFLAFIEDRDRRALALLESSRPEEFLRALSADGNATRVCSAGCMYVLASVLQDATPELKGYHQAYTREAETCVTCTALTYTR
jgi:AmmeMemoRadiSam system protein B